MNFLKQLTYNKYAFWLGDGINKKLNISTKHELAEKIYSQLSEETKNKINNKATALNLSEVSQVFLDTATGSSHNLLSLLTNDLKYFGEAKPYSYLSKIPSVDTVLTHDHSKILEHIWEDGEIHNVFKEKDIIDEKVNLFKILGDYTHVEQLVLTSQNLRKVKKLKLYNHFWKKLSSQLSSRNLILMGLTLDQDTKEILEFIFSKLNTEDITKYFVTSTPLSSEESLWLNLNGFELIFKEDEDFIREFYLHYTGLSFEDDLPPKDTIKDLEEIITTENIKDFSGLLDIEDLISKNEKTSVPNEYKKENNSLEKVEPEELEIIEIEKVETNKDTKIEEVVIEEGKETPIEISQAKISTIEERNSTDIESDTILVDQNNSHKDYSDLKDTTNQKSYDEDLKLIKESMAILENTPGFDLKKNLGIEVSPINIDDLTVENNHIKDHKEDSDIFEADPNTKPDDTSHKHEIVIEDTIVKLNDLTVEGNYIEDHKESSDILEVDFNTEPDDTSHEHEIVIKETIVEVDDKEEDKKEDKEYIVENLEIPIFINKDIINAQIFETETRDRGKRLVEFREKRYPSYKIDDFSELDYYKALNIKLPIQSKPLPLSTLGKKEFSGKVDIKCGDRAIYGINLKSHISEKQQVVEFKNHDFQLILVLKNSNVTNFFYKISENTVNIKGLNTYLFFKNLFSGLELSFKNKKTSGAFKLLSDSDLETITTISNTLEQYFEVKKHMMIRNIRLKELLNNTNSLKVLYSFYTSKPKVIKGNFTLRTFFESDHILDCNSLITSYPISMNFLGKSISFIESSNISINRTNINKNNNQVEIQAFNVEQNITYSEVLR